MLPHQVHLSIGFPKQEYWSGLPFPSLGDLCGLGIEPGWLSCVAGNSLLSEPPRRSLLDGQLINNKNLLLTVPEAEKSMIKVPTDLLPGECLLPVL